MKRDQRIFLSHHSGDAVLAQRLAADLRKRGSDVWISSDSIAAGDDWVASISQGLEKSSTFVVLLSAASVKSSWVQQEVNTAIARERKGKIRLIPLKSEPCEVPPLWGIYQAISFQASYTGGLKQLQAALTKKKHTVVQESATATMRPLDEYARLYDGLYRRLPSDVRNYVLNAVIVDFTYQFGSKASVSPQQMRALFDRGSDGDRIVALLLAQTAPAVGSLNWILEAVKKSRSPFEQFHGLRALKLMTHLLKGSSIKRVRQVLRQSPFLERTNESRWGVYQSILETLGNSEVRSVRTHRAQRKH